MKFSPLSNTLRHRLTEAGKDLRFAYRARRFQLQHWIIRRFMPVMFDHYRDILISHSDWQISAVGAKKTIADLRLERAELTEVLMSLVAKDEQGLWTTVFDADTRIPAELCGPLDELVSRA